MTDEALRFEAREYDADASGTDLRCPLNFLTSERALRSSGEEFEHTVGVRAVGDPEAFLGGAFELVDADRHLRITVCNRM